jgi:hypothetical protein
MPAVIKHKYMHGSEISLDSENISTRNEAYGTIHIIHAVDQ